MPKRDKAPREEATSRKETYKGHEILFPRDQRRKKIFIDGRPVNWGEANGTFYLDVYAYDRGETLDETIQRYLNYLDQSGSKAAQEVQ
jgi:hypothetical protein